MCRNVIENMIYTLQGSLISKILSQKQSSVRGEKYGILNVMHVSISTHSIINQ